VREETWEKKEGALSLISIGTEAAGHIFLFDAVKLAQQHPPMKSLMHLLGDPKIGKIMWDGCWDFLEIWENYGTALYGVLDLQVAEVVSRGAYRGEKARHRKTRLARSQFGRKDILPHVKQYPDIHLLIGMQTCLDENNLGAGLKKDSEQICTWHLPHRVHVEIFTAEVVAMHRDGGSGLWMERPLPANLLRYAANDIFLISRLHEHFLNMNWISEADMSILLTQPECYVSMHKKLGRIEASNYFRKGPLLPMDILNVGPLAHGECAGCGRNLSKAAYETRPNGKSLLLRRTRCRICHAVAIQRKMPSDESWVEV
jgi:exonuclease 3'-5' domain-containing protein 1